MRCGACGKELPENKPEHPCRQRGWRDCAEKAERERDMLQEKCERLSALIDKADLEERTVHEGMNHRAEKAERERDEAREGRKNWQSIAETRGRVSDGMKARVKELEKELAALQVNHDAAVEFAQTVNEDDDAREERIAELVAENLAQFQTINSHLYALRLYGDEGNWEEVKATDGYCNAFTMDSRMPWQPAQGALPKENGNHAADA